ncbi:MAG TPA: tetratricopeptide repeat protein [Candidatus Limnocylindrales bacterium]
MELIEEYRRALLWMDAGDPIEAARILESVIAAEPGNCDVRLRLALAYFASAQLTKAEGHLRELVARNPSDHYAHHVLGRTLERQGRAGEALPFLRLADAMASVPDYGVAVERVAARVAATS